MTVLFFDGFDHYALNSTGDLAQKWAIVNISGTFGGGDTVQSGAGRVTGNAVNLFQGTGGGNGMFGLLHNLQPNNYARLGVGFGYKPPPAQSAGCIVQFWDLTTSQIAITQEANQQLMVVRGPANTGTVLGQTALNAIPPGAWQLIEVQVVFASGTGGSIVVAINGVTLLNLTGINTIQTANAYANGVSIGGMGHAGNQCQSPGSFWDDLYLLDLTAGLGSGGLIGDRRVVTQLGTGNSGDTAGHDQWGQTGGTAGNFWTSVNDNPHDSDTSYLSSAVVNQISNFTHAALPANITAITAVQYNLETRKDDIGTRQIAATQRNGTTDSVGTTSPNLSQTYQNFMQLSEVSLQTGVAWTITEWNASEFGVKLIA